jgi:hypothetical protein
MDESEQMYLTLYATIYSNLITASMNKGDKYFSISEYERCAKEATTAAQFGHSHWWNDRGREKHQRRQHDASSELDKLKIKHLEENVGFERRLAIIEGYLSLSKPGDRPDKQDGVETSQ